EAFAEYIRKLAPPIPCISDDTIADAVAAAAAAAEERADPDTADPVKPGRKKSRGATSYDFKSEPAARRRVMAHSWSTAPGIASRLHCQTGCEALVFIRAEGGDTFVFVSPNLQIDTVLDAMTTCVAQGRAFVLNPAQPAAS